MVILLSLTVPSKLRMGILSLDINDEFTIKYLDLRHRKDGYIEFRPANKDFKPIRIDADDDFEVWGVVIWTIKKWR